MLAEIDIAALVEGGGAGGVGLVALSLWRIGSFVKDALSETKSALKEWREEAKVRQSHYTAEETLLRELKDERKLWESARQAEAGMRRELIKVRADFDSLERRVDRSRHAEVGG